MTHFSGMAGSTQVSLGVDAVSKPARSLPNEAMTQPLAARLQQPLSTLSESTRGCVTRLINACSHDRSLPASVLACTLPTEHLQFCY
jgi:hypothetical protein